MGADRLEQRLEVENAGREPLRFTTALHTYFAVASIHEVPPFMQRPGGRPRLLARGGPGRVTEAQPVSLSDRLRRPEAHRCFVDLCMCTGAASEAQLKHGPGSMDAPGEPAGTCEPVAHVQRSLLVRAVQI